MPGTARRRSLQANDARMYVENAIRIGSSPFPRLPCPQVRIVQSASPPLLLRNSFQRVDGQGTDARSDKKRKRKITIRHGPKGLEKRL